MVKRLTGREIKERYKNERKTGEESAIKIAESINKVYAIAYLIGQYRALTILSLKNPLFAAELYNKMWVIEHALAILVKYANSHDGYKSMNLIDNFVDATDGYLSAAQIEHNAECFIGEKLPDGRLKLEMNLEIYNSKNFSIYKQYLDRLAVYNYREETPMKKDELYEIYLNEFSPMNNSIKKCTGNTAEQIIDFVDRYIYKQLKILEIPGIDFNFKNIFKWNVSTFKWSWDELKHLCPKDFNLKKFLEVFSFTSHDKNFKVQCTIASYLRRKPFIKINEHTWYISIDLLLKSLITMTRDLLEKKKHELGFQKELDKKKEEQFLNSISDIFKQYGYFEIERNKSFLLGKEKMEIDLLFKDPKGRYLCVEAKTTKPNLSLLFDASYPVFVRELDNPESDTRKDLHQLERLNNLLKLKEVKKNLCIDKESSIRLISITKYPHVTTHISDIFCCTLYECKELLKNGVDLCDDVLHIKTRFPQTVPSKIPEEFQDIISEKRFHLIENEAEDKIPDGWILWDRKTQGFVCKKFNNILVLTVFYNKREAVQYSQKEKGRYAIFPLNKRDSFWIEMLKRQNLKIFIGTFIDDSTMKGRVVEPEDFFIKDEMG